MPKEKSYEELLEIHHDYKNILNQIHSDKNNPNGSNHFDIAVRFFEYHNPPKITHRY